MNVGTTVYSSISKLGENLAITEMHGLTVPCRRLNFDSERTGGNMLTV